MLSSRVLTVLRVSSRSVSIALILPLRLSLETRASSRLRRMRFFSRAFLSSFVPLGDAEEAGRFREVGAGTETGAGVGTGAMTGGSRRRSRVGSMTETKGGTNEEIERCGIWGDGEEDDNKKKKTDGMESVV